MLNTVESGHEKMNEEENLRCTYCGASVSRTDTVCRNCGKDLSTRSEPVQSEPTASVQAPSEVPYERKYSVFQRFYKLIVSPSEAMKDIGLMPDYGGPIVLLILETILMAAAFSLAFQKIQLIGDSQMVSQVSGLLSAIIALTVVIGFFLLLVFWLVKSLLVKYFCDEGSSWSFGTAASVTGYAYLADAIFMIISLVVVFSWLPSVTLNVSDLAAARQAVVNFQAQVLWIRLIVGIPVGFVRMLWKSYLGGLGTKVGTQGRSSVERGFAVFLVLALLGWLISFLIRGTV